MYIQDQPLLTIWFSFSCFHWPWSCRSFLRWKAYTSSPYS